MIKRIKQYVCKFLINIIIEDYNNDGKIRQIVEEEKRSSMYYAIKFPQIIKKAGCESEDI
jgi:hypothetical protein